VPFSENLRGVEPSATLAVAALAHHLRATGHDIVDLSAGEPDFNTPDFIGQAAIAAILDGKTRYTATPGVLELRTAIAQDLQKRSAHPVDPAGIVVANGAKQALFNACFALFNPGDRVLLPTPYWTSYPALIRLARAQPVEVAGEPENSFKLSPAELERASDERTRGLILNSPSNPTGAVYTRDELEAILRWAAERELWVISDEIYAHICFLSPQAPGVLEFPPELLRRTVLVDGASKRFAMTGWRIGFTYSAPALAGTMAALQSHVSSNAATPSQHAAVAAYSAEPLEAEATASMSAIFQRRRDLLLELFRTHLPELPFVHPDGAFYLFFRADPCYGPRAPDSIAFCRLLLEQGGVALVPGAAFGDDRYVRLSFAASESMLSQGVERIAAVVRAT
jgi:aspartate aminotransferase